MFDIKADGTCHHLNYQTDPNEMILDALHSRYTHAKPVMEM